MAQPTTAAPAKRAGWSGNTKRTLETGAMLGASWWTVGDKVSCLFQREFETKFGKGHEFMLVQPRTMSVFIDEFGKTYKKQPADGAAGVDREITRFAIPPLAGFDMAVQDMEASGFPGFWFGARCIIECTEVQLAKEFGFSDMPIFNISVDPR